MTDICICPTCNNPTPFTDLFELPGKHQGKEYLENLVCRICHYEQCEKLHKKEGRQYNFDYQSRNIILKLWRNNQLSSENKERFAKIITTKYNVPLFVFNIMWNEYLKFQGDTTKNTVSSPSLKLKGF